jgi:hypothetical protein
MDQGSWLAACGKGTKDRTCEVTKVVPTLAAEGSGFEVMYEILIDGRPWIVAKCRTVGEV